MEQGSEYFSLGIWGLDHSHFKAKEDEKIKYKECKAKRGNPLLKIFCVY